MHILDRIKQTFTAVGQSFSRFPLSYLFLVAATVTASLWIEDAQDAYPRYFFTLIVGAMVAAVGQVITERFFNQSTRPRYFLMALAILSTMAYYFILSPIATYHIEFPVKTSVILFALVIALIWVPTLGANRLAFHQNLLAVFKAFFTALLFAIILSLGMFAVFSAVNNLLFDLHDDLILHILNVIWVFLASIYCFSLLPHDDNEIPINSNSNSSQTNAFTLPRFFEVLLSYVVIPLTLIYTLILIAYIIINFSDQFWTDNLLEPLLVTYSIVSLLVYLLSFNLNQSYIALFRKIFPKILIPIVAFQTVASVLKIQDSGLTHGRYFVILFGLFATIAAVLYSFNKERYHGWSAIILLVFALVSITPPIDAFTLSRNNHIQQLETVLEANQMLADCQLTRNDSISQEDKITITRLVDYIDRMEYHRYTGFLPEEFDYYRDFDDLFGFNRTYGDSDFNTEVMREYASWNWQEQAVIDIEAYNSLVKLYLYQQEEALERLAIEHQGRLYYLDREFDEDYLQLRLIDDQDQELLTYDTQELFDQIFNEDFTSELLGYEFASDEGLVMIDHDPLTLQIQVVFLNRTATYVDGEINLYIRFK